MQHDPGRQTRHYPCLRKSSPIFRTWFLLFAYRRDRLTKSWHCRLLYIQGRRNFCAQSYRTGTGGARIGVQAFDFWLFIRKKKLPTAIMRVLSGIVYTLRDAILRRTRNRQGLYTTFVKKPSSSILTYCLPKLGLL